MKILNTSLLTSCLLSSAVAFSPQAITPQNYMNRMQLYASKRSGAMSRKNKKSDSSSPSGFGKTPEKQEAEVKQDAGKIYSRPALYDLAFGYRNYEEEVRFLIDAYEKYATCAKDKPMRIIELAAGPARHAITALRCFNSKVQSTTAVDISKDMIEYSNEVADEELGDRGFGGMRDKFQYIEQDMRKLTESSSFKTGTYDNAWILLGSMQHLTTNDDVINCFSSISNILTEGGILSIELPHPRETFTMVECTRNGWEVPLEDENGEEYGELKIIWGDDDDKFDPIRQVRDFTVAMELVLEEGVEDEESNMQNVKEVVPMRLFTFQEIEALARIAGFEVVGMQGALSDEVDVNSEDEAFRLVCILRKISNPIM